MPEIHVVEDNVDHADLVIWGLQSLRLPIRLYRNGESFLAQVRDRPGCVVLDMVLPGINGFDVVQALRSRRIEIPVVCVSGFPDVGREVRARSMGVVDFIAKPVDVISLRHAVALALARDEKLRRRREDAAVVAGKISSLDDIVLDVLRKAVGGASNRETSASLKLGLRTVERHRASGLKAMGCRTVRELVALLAKSGLDL